MDSSSEEDDYVLETNPLLINLIVERLMDFLTLKNVKNCRLVCHKWNSFAEPVLKKRGKIVFTPFFRPSEFMAHFAEPHHLAQPFTSFSLVAGRDIWQQIKHINEDFDKPNNRWTLSEINEFFMKWGKYIKKLELSLFQVWLNRDDRYSDSINWLNIDHLFESMGSNLEDLDLVGLGSIGAVEVSLNKLSSVKNICLDTCYVNLDSFEKKLTPSKFKSVNVIFRRNEQTIPSAIINDFVDLSRCSDINLKKESKIRGAISTIIEFDFSREFVNCHQIKFDKIVALNVKKSKTKTNRLMICYGPTEPVQIHLKELELRHCEIDLTLISGTIIEKLTVKECDVVSLDILPLDLPNLKCFSFTPYSYETTSGSAVYKIIALFVNCENLSDLELTRNVYSDDKVESELDVDYLPKSLKVLKLRQNHALKFVGSNDPTEVDILILMNEDERDDSKNRLSIKEILERIKTKVLIRAVFRHESFFRDEPKESVSQIIADIVQDKKLETTIVELKHGPHILKTLEPVDQSKSCENSTDKSSSIYHEFKGQFLVTDKQSADFDGYLARPDTKQGRHYVKAHRT